MKLEDQVCSLESAKRLKELGVPQQGIHSWLRTRSDKPYELDKDCKFETEDKEAWFSAFTVAELGGMVSKAEIDTGDVINYSPIDLSYYEHSYDGDYPGKWVNFQADTEAEARARMLIYLMENNLIERPE